MLIAFNQDGGIYSYVHGDLWVIKRIVLTRKILVATKVDILLNDPLHVIFINISHNLVMKK